MLGCPVPGYCFWNTRRLGFRRNKPRSWHSGSSSQYEAAGSWELARKLLREGESTCRSSESISARSQLILQAQILKTDKSQVAVAAGQNCLDIHFLLSEQLTHGLLDVQLSQPLLHYLHSLSIRLFPTISPHDLLSWFDTGDRLSSLVLNHRGRNSDMPIEGTTGEGSLLSQPPVHIPVPDIFGLI